MANNSSHIYGEDIRNEKQHNRNEKSMMNMTVVIIGLLSTRILSGSLLGSLCQVIISDLVSSLDSLGRDSTTYLLLSYGK